MPEDVQLRLKNLQMRYAGGRPVLEDVSLDLPAGDFVALIGPRGCGKSTLLRLIAGIETPTGGSITDTELPENARLAGTAFLFQDAALLPWRTVEDNVRLPLELRHTPRAEAEATVREQLRALAIAHVGQRYPRQLSPGMRLRVSLARALAIRPRTLLLDEPFGALDAIARNKLNAELMRLREQQPFTAIGTTHSVAEAVFWAKRVVVLAAHPGRIAAEVAIDAPYPRTPEWRDSPAFQTFTAEVREQLNAVSGQEGAAA